MKKLWIFLGIIALVAAVDYGIYLCSSDDYCEMVEYDETQLLALAEGDHSGSDSIVRNAVKLYAFHHTDEAFRQLEDALKVDSSYWVVELCRAYLMDCEMKQMMSIRHYERAWELMNEPGETFDTGGGVVFSEPWLLKRLSELYATKWAMSGEEWYKHFSEELYEAAMESERR